MKAWRPYMMPWASLGFQIKLRLFKKLSLSGQREFTGPRTVTDVIKCFISEITPRRRAAPAAAGLCICRSRARKDPWPPSPTTCSFAGDILISAEVKERRFRLFLFIQKHSAIQITDAEDSSSWTFNLTSGDIKHPFPVSFCWVATVFIWPHSSF